MAWSCHYICRHQSQQRVQEQKGGGGDWESSSNSSSSRAHAQVQTIRTLDRAVQGTWSHVVSGTMQYTRCRSLGGGGAAAHRGVSTEGALTAGCDINSTTRTRVDRSVATVTVNHQRWPRIICWFGERDKMRVYLPLCRPEGVPSRPSTRCRQCNFRRRCPTLCTTVSAGMQFVRWRGLT